MRGDGVSVPSGARRYDDRSAGPCFWQGQLQMAGGVSPLHQLAYLGLGPLGFPPVRGAGDGTTA
jgi:hypothetical protein